MSEEERIDEARREMGSAGFLNATCRRTCLRKTQHESEAYACWEAVRLSVLTGKDIRAYRCWHCAYFHCGCVVENGAKVLLGDHL